MGKFKSDIEIARKAKLKPIKYILKKLKVPDKSFAFSPMGRHIAKINFEFINKLKKKKRRKINFSNCYISNSCRRRKNNYISRLI